MIFTDLPPSFVKGEEVELLPPDICYCPEVYKLISNFTQLHYRFLLWAKPDYPIEACYKNFESAADHFKKDKEEYRFLIMDRRAHNIIGCISLFIRDARIPFYEIGYWIGAQSMGKGFMTEACILVRNIACHYLKCQRLEIKTASTNVASAKVALAAGFQLEARLKKHRLDGFGKIDDTCIYTYPIE